MCSTGSTKSNKAKFYTKISTLFKDMNERRFCVTPTIEQQPDDKYLFFNF